MADSQLFIWMRILVRYLRSDQPDLSNLQIALLLLVCMTPGPHSLRDLAQQLRAPKSVASRGLSKLAKLGLLQQGRDERERRKSLIQPTAEGLAFVDRLSRTITAKGLDNDGGSPAAGA